MRKIITFVMVFCVMATMLCVCTASAATVAENQDSYLYTYWQESVDSPTGYAFDKVISSANMGIDSLKSPSDFYVDDNSNLLYILDSGNGRIVVVNENYKCEKIIDSFIYKNEKLDIVGAQGVFVNKGKIVIADTEHNRVIVSDLSGKVSMVLTKPNATSYGEETVYNPSKVVMDSAGNFYVVCKGVYKGAVVYDPKGNYVGFYGSNDVTLTLKVIANAFWKKILSEEQTSQMISAVPVEFSNLDIDAEGFIYSSTKSDSENRKNTIRKLNYAGDNVLKADAAPVSNKFGTLDFNLDAVFDDTQFADVHIANDGIISGLDSVSGKIFQYDQEGRLVSIFADAGEYAGSFVTPTALEYFNNQYIVLDGDKNSITAFSLTEYGKVLFEAISLYNNGKYEKSYELWNEILKINSNSEIAYQGMADALYSLGRADEALEYYKLAYDQEGYSEAFEYVRGAFLKKHFLVLMLILACLCILPFVLINMKRKNKINSKQVLVDRKAWHYPFRMMIHPADSCQDMRYLKKERYKVAFVILFMWYFVTVLKAQLSGFLFNLNPIGNVNILLIFLSTVGIFVIFTISNWSISTLSDGEGNYKQIFCVCSYALLPAIIGTLLSTVLSNVLILEEAIFVNWIQWIANGYTIFLMVIGLKHEHQYEGKSTVLNFIFSAIGLLLILFLILLLFSLMQQLYVFLRTVIFEVSIRNYV